MTVVVVLVWLSEQEEEEKVRIHYLGKKGNNRTRVFVMIISGLFALDGCEKIMKTYGCMLNRPVFCIFCSFLPLVFWLSPDYLLNCKTNIWVTIHTNPSVMMSTFAIGSFRIS